MDVKGEVRLGVPWATTPPRPNDGSISDRSGYIEGRQWWIERVGSSHKVRIEGGGFDVSTPDGYAGLFRLIEALKDITRPVLSEAT